MMSGSLRRLWIVLALALLFVLWPARDAFGFAQSRYGSSVTAEQARQRLTQGFGQILEFFSQHDFSLVTAWREMRASADPEFFEHKYPAISQEIDAWAATLERRFGVDSAAEGRLDLTFLITEFSPLALDAAAPDVGRDNALATICMVCVMDNLRCDPAVFHRFLATVVAEDTSTARKTEALRWWRRSNGSIDEGLLESVLASPAGSDLELRSEIARVLFSAGTHRSLEAQRMLAGTAGLPEDPSGGLPQIACAAIRHFARARFERAVPDMIAALQDPSREVRACAAESLGKLSGRDFGFDPSSGGASNLEAISGWRSWWEQRDPDPPRATQ